ncbi:COPII coat assembly protein sec-16 OS=Neurospora crassa (strain ATCC 24698 / 74-OR23-1A / CBS 708,71 / DSM 1257 / FGSC 987) GN=sec-16 PE=3 SV=1 [Rhizoctonia solani AG-1 IB]|uniref:Protein transport protein sec16 n=1 Tax=Thanatephorus cucumeris (strain AG1-IB / isolate 7/3/14) TaxID=1108050 RepID=A0A0B7F293_THACB|nr:COPII coat assembly protein sec-16 OS=Neurospora crassa (strain ATCC 24698 / 74-OR23-1A / CBS 708,71 / DSM 1257 / FGSC 987) GN=sec-16 PE=3 SV=1 [Rhizoctonia solani AG-1 IB]
MADPAPPAADALFGGSDDKNDSASSLFDTGSTATDDVQDIAGVFGAPIDDKADPFASVGQNSDVAGNAGGSSPVAISSALDDYANQGWFDDDGKFHLYEDPNDTFNAATATTPAQVKSYTPSAYTPAQTHSASRVPSHSSPAAQYAPPPASPYEPTRSSSGLYAPTSAYAPPANQYTPANTYTPPTNTYVPPTNAYGPQTTAYAPPKSPYAPTTSSFIPPPPTSYAPPPPPPASTNEHLRYRSPSANAYDPPIPAARKRIDSAASSVSTPGHGTPALVSPFGQTAPSGAYPSQPGHGQPSQNPPLPPGPPRSRAGSQVTGPTRTLSPAHALNRTGSPLSGMVRATSPLAGAGALRAATGPTITGSPQISTALPYAPPVAPGQPPVPPKSTSSYDPPAAGTRPSHYSPAVQHSAPVPPARSATYDPPPTGTKSVFDPPLPSVAPPARKNTYDPPRTGTKSAFDPPMTGTKSAFDPPLRTGTKSAFDPPMTGRKNAFDPPMTGRKSAFDPPPPPAGPPSRPGSRVGNSTTSSPVIGPPRPASGFAQPGPPPGHVPPQRPGPPSRPASSASMGAGRYAPSLDTSNAGFGLGVGGEKGSKSAIVGGSRPWDTGADSTRASLDSEGMDGPPGRGSLDGADSGYKSRTSIDDAAGSEMWTKEEWTRGDDPEGGDAEGGPGPAENQWTKPEYGSNSTLDPEGGVDPEGGLDEADTTLHAPTESFLGVGPQIMETAPTPLASPGTVPAEFAEDDAEGGFGAVSPAGEPSSAPGTKPLSRTASVSSLASGRSGHRTSPSISKRPAPVVVEPPPNSGNYVVDNQPYTPMYGQSPYADVQTSPPKQTITEPYAPKPADTHVPPKPVDLYAPPPKDPYAPPKPAAIDPYAPPKLAGEPTQKITYSPPNGLARVYTPPPQANPAASRPVPVRNGSTLSRKSSLASIGEFGVAKDPYAPPARDPYAPPVPASKDPYAPPAAKDPYAPPVANASPYAPPRATPQDIKRPSSTAYDPPMPAVLPAQHASSYTPGVPAEMYAPRRDSRAREQSDQSDYEGANGHMSRYNYPSTDPYQPGGKSATPAAYQPTSGGVDPLGRHDSRAPIISFGFGGRLATAFPGLSELTGGFDVSLGRKAPSIQIRMLHKIVPESAVETSSAVFPGPLFSDPGSPTKGLVNVAVGGSGAKTKKAAVLKYLGERAEEIERGLGYLGVDAGNAPGPSERSKSEGKLVLVNLLKIMVENDGKLTGTPVIDAAVRQALVPRLSSIPAVTSPNSQATSFTLASALDVTVTSPGMDQYSLSPGNGDSPVATYKVKPDALDKIQEFLLQGERRQAYHYALDERMWAHSMLIASSLDKDAWKEVVNEFIRSELGVRTDQKKPSPFGGDPSVANGREPLRVAYSLFAGHGPASIQELLPPKNLARADANSLMPPTMSMVHATPISPNFPQPVLTSSVPTPALLQWNEIAATIVSNQADPQALTALGDYLVSNKWVEAAHACYLLSPTTSALGGISTPSVRVVLLGSESPATSRNFEKDDDAVIFTEIAEYAYSLAPTVKGQDAYAGLPHLQAYKLLRAAKLAEMGHVALASRYCEAVVTSTRIFNRPSPFFTPTFVEQCKELSDYLSGVPQLDSSGSWIGKKVAKPSLDSIGNWLSGGLTKLIAGDGEEFVAATEPGPKAESGAFSHYSSISSTNTSQTPSPNASVVALPSQPSVPPPRRAGSAMAQRPGSAAAQRNAVPTHPDRSASAMDYLRLPANKGSPAVPAHALSANAATTTFYQADVGYRAEQDVNKTGEDDDNAGATYTSWWGGADESSGPTPTATTFYQMNDTPASTEGEGEGGFISLMDTFSPMPSPAPGGSSFSSTPKEPIPESGDRKEKEKEPEAKPEPKEEAKSEAPKLSEAKQSSWLGRWWPRKDTDSPAPVKAHLGDQVSLVYDKELKRWVNPNAPKPEPTATPPPPPSRTPSRAQTGSPGPGPSPLGRSNDPASTPPSRPQSASSLVPPPSISGPRRVRSMLNESFGPGGDISSSETNSPTSTPPASLRGPPSRGSTPGGKRNVRSRYVDVFAQPPPSPST